MSGIIDYFKSRGKKCRVCDRTAAIAGSLIKKFPELRPVEQVKDIVEYRCNNCGALWYEAPNRSYVSRIRNIELYQRWKTTDCKPTSEQTALLRKIGGTEDIRGISVSFPCGTANVKGERSERTVIIVSKVPWFGHATERNISFLTGDVEIYPSRYALSYEIRKASAEAPEKAMGYAPICVADRTGFQYTLAARSLFFEAYEVLGPELELIACGEAGKNKVWPLPAERVFLADWVDDLEW